jgi:hypothetical protein
LGTKPQHFFSMRPLSSLLSAVGVAVGTISDAPRRSATRA